MPGPSDAQKAVEEFQRLLDVQDASASAQVIRAYAPVYSRLQKDTRELVQVAKKLGLNKAQVTKRMRDLELQFLANTARFSDAAGGFISNSQRVAVGLARRGAEQTVAAGLPPGIRMENLANVGLGWNRLPDEAFTSFVGIAGDGKPIGNLLAPLGAEAAGEVKDAIGTGIALGKGPRETAELVRVAAGIPLSKALLITRTETLRAFRESTRLQYANNSQVIKGYRRLADKNARTCIACLSLDGTLYDLDEPLNEHPNGRCAMVPETITYQDLGLDVEMPSAPETGQDWLRRQSEEKQLDMLGPARFNAFKAGQLDLGDLAQVNRSAVWGDIATVKSVKNLGLDKVAAPSIPKLPPTPDVEVIIAKTAKGEILSSADEVALIRSTEKVRIGPTTSLPTQPPVATRAITPKVDPLEGRPFVGEFEKARFKRISQDLPENIEQEMQEFGKGFDHPRAMSREMRTVLEDELDNAIFTHNTSADNIKKILDDGIQPRTGITGKAKTSTTRDINQHYGDAVYGSIQMNEAGLAHFGDVTIKMKSSIMERALLGPLDTGGVGVYAERAVPATRWKEALTRKLGDNYSPASFPENILGGRQRIKERISQEMERQYVELQIYGGVDITEIAEIVLDEFFATHPAGNAIMAAAKNKNIPVTFRRTGKPAAPDLADDDDDDDFEFFDEPDDN